MDLILIFVVLPLATIIFSIALQRLLKCPILVAAVVFAIFLILTYTVFGTDFLIFAILFAILAFITAFLVSLFCRIIKRLRNLEGRNSDRDCDCDDDDCSCGCSRNGRARRNGNSRRNRRCNCDCNNDNNDDNLLTISSTCRNGETSDLLTISTGGTCGNNNNNNNNCNCNSGNNNCSCNNNNTSNERIVLNAEVVPSNNGNSGAFRGCFRRRWN